VKATIDIPDDLYRKVKAKSALEGRPVREVAISLFRQWVEQQDRAPKAVPTALELMRDGCGIVDSGLGDLSTNPKHLEGFGRD
jgi:hypothetical protein